MLPFAIGLVVAIPLAHRVFAHHWLVGTKETLCVFPRVARNGYNEKLRIHRTLRCSFRLRRGIDGPAKR